MLVISFEDEDENENENKKIARPGELGLDLVYGCHKSRGSRHQNVYYLKGRMASLSSSFSFPFSFSKRIPGGPMPQKRPVF
jgi:hypothetical protein